MIILMMAWIWVRRVARHTTALRMGRAKVRLFWIIWFSISFALWSQAYVLIVRPSVITSCGTGGVNQGEAAASWEVIQQWADYYRQQGYTEEDVQAWIATQVPDYYNAEATTAAADSLAQEQPQQTAAGDGLNSEDVTGVAVGLHIDGDGVAAEELQDSVPAPAAEQESIVAEQGSSKGHSEDLPASDVSNPCMLSIELTPLICKAAPIACSFSPV
jgi:hypothetical protein